jgi:hypothetical protein
MRKILLLCLFLVGCSDDAITPETIKQMQIDALREYLTENAVLSEPIIIDNIIGNDIENYHGIIKFKTPGTKKIQKVLCTGVLYDSEIKLAPFGSVKRLSIICE